MEHLSKYNGFGVRIVFDRIYSDELFLPIFSTMFIKRVNFTKEIFFDCDA